MIAGNCPDALHPIDDADVIRRALAGAAIDDIARELVRRCEQLCAMACAAKERSSTTHDLVVVADSAEKAHVYALQCHRLSNAVDLLLGTADMDTVRNGYAHSRMAATHAQIARDRWEQLRRVMGVAHA